MVRLLAFISIRNSKRERLTKAYNCFTFVSFFFFLLFLPEAFVRFLHDTALTNTGSVAAHPCVQSVMLISISNGFNLTNLQLWFFKSCFIPAKPFAGMKQLTNASSKRMLSTILLYRSVTKEKTIGVLKK